jgi:hypothetical protein
VAHGNGPKRAVLRAGVRALVQDTPRFGHQGDFFQPIFYSILPTPREKEFWVTGTWCALHLLHLGLMPDPITPWLIYAAVGGKDRFRFDLDYIRALDPTSAKILKPWFEFDETGVLGENDPLNPIRQLLITYLNISDVSLVQFLYLPVSPGPSSPPSRRPALWNFMPKQPNL